jgi:[ribosomal protein S5]-alanine N-acetyltransferase
VKLLKEFPDFTTERLVLRELSLNDTDFVYKHFSDLDVCKYLLDEEPLSQVSEAEDIINWYLSPEGKNHNRWGIEIKVDSTLIGTCGFHCWDKKNNIAEIGYDLRSKYWGRGYMSEAMQVALKNGFENMRLNRIQAFTYIENEKSIRLLERFGFKNEGIIRDKHYFRGQYYDHYCFSLLKREWNQAK